MTNRVLIRPTMLPRANANAKPNGQSVTGNVS